MPALFRWLHLRCRTCRELPKPPMLFAHPMSELEIQRWRRQRLEWYALLDFPTSLKENE